MLRWLADQFTALRLSLAFFTLLPVAPRKDCEQKLWGVSLSYLWFTSLLFGVVSLGVFFAMLAHFNFYAGEANLFKIDVLYQKPLLFSLVVFLAPIFLSGGLHIDGLMDSFDGIAASKATKEETLEVMKDSRVGAFGALAAFVVLLVGFVLTYEVLQSKLTLLILLLAPVFSRYMMLLHLVTLTNSQSSAAHMLQDANKTVIVVLNSLAAIVLLILVPAYLLAPVGLLALWFTKLAIATLLSALTYKYLKHKLYELNGDSLGAGLVIAEILFCLVFVA